MVGVLVWGPILESPKYASRVGDDRHGACPALAVLEKTPFGRILRAGSRDPRCPASGHQPAQGADLGVRAGLRDFRHRRHAGAPPDGHPGMATNAIMRPSSWWRSRVGLFAGAVIAGLLVGVVVALTIQFWPEASGAVMYLFMALSCCCAHAACWASAGSVRMSGLLRHPVLWTVLVLSGLSLLWVAIGAPISLITQIASYLCTVRASALLVSYTACARSAPRFFGCASYAVAFACCAAPTTQSWATKSWRCLRRALLAGPRRGHRTRSSCAGAPLFLLADARLLADRLEIAFK